jgi:hypothetical protein
VRGVGCEGCVGCVGVWGCGVWGCGSLLTFDIPQTALVATLDTYDLLGLDYNSDRILITGLGSSYLNLEH